MEERTLRLIRLANPHWEGVPDPLLKPELIEREVGVLVKKWFDKRLMIALVGPRRSGKSTLMRQMIAELIRDGADPRSIMYFSFDELTAREPEILDEIVSWHRENAPTTPSSHRTYFFLDEIQQIDYWQTILKRHYDLTGPRLKFVLSGSESLEIRRKSIESLAGRLIDFRLWPLSFREFLAARGIMVPRIPFPKTFRELERAMGTIAVRTKDVRGAFGEYLIRGGFPETHRLDSMALVREYVRSAVLEKVVYRDLGRLASLGDPGKLFEILQIVAANSSSLLEIQNLSGDLGISRPTISKCIWLLEQAYLVSFCYNFTKSRVKQMRSSKKAYVTDNSIITTLEGLDESSLGYPEVVGRLAETLVRNHFARESQVYFWRDKAQREVDLVIRKVEGVLPVEVKFREKIRGSDLDGIETFMAQRKSSRGLVVTKDSLEERGDVWLLPGWFVCLLPSDPWPWT